MSNFCVHSKITLKIEIDKFKFCHNTTTTGHRAKTGYDYVMAMILMMRQNDIKWIMSSAYGSPLLRAPRLPRAINSNTH